MKKLNGNQKKFLGTVPKKYQLVETFWDCPEISKTSNKGITLIALIITIIFFYDENALGVNKYKLEFVDKYTEDKTNGNLI